MSIKKIIVVRKMSSLEYYYKGNHTAKDILDADKCHNQNIKKIERLLKKSKIDFDIVTRKDICEKLISSYDAVISAGGDGTVIATASFNLNVPQLNLKTDFRSAGALCQDDIFKSLDALLSSSYNIEEWQRQDIYFNSKFISRATNETCIGEKLRFDHLAKYNLDFTGLDNISFSENQSASGLIIVTGTGSTGWPSAFSAYSRKDSFFKFKTILQHAGSICHGDATYLKIEYKGHEGMFSIDTKEYNFPRDSYLEIKLSKNPLKVVTLK